MTSNVDRRMQGDGVAGADGRAVPLGISLQDVRDEIDRVDEAIVTLLARRARLADAARDCKDGLGLPLFDHAREAAIVRRAAERAGAERLDPELARDIFWRIVEMARVRQLDATSSQ